MTRQTQNILYQTLPIVFWLLAGLVSVLGWVLSPLAWSLTNLLAYTLPPLMALVIMWVLTSIRRHGDSKEECFWTGLLIAIASYWLPSVVFLLPVAWGYLIYRNIFSFRSFLATWIGFAVVAVWVAVFDYAGILKMPSFLGRAGVDFLPWVSTGSVIVAFVASTIARQILRAR
ncbi:MAG: hypothetical protein IKQ48_02905 [Paludibacteraceae bacterium]|nr:hypothetical protein [Paludibacteraceae bacterium]